MKKNTTHFTNYQQSKHWPTPHIYTTHKGLPKPIKEDSSKYYWISVGYICYKQCTQYIIVDSAIEISCQLLSVAPQLIRCYTLSGKARHAGRE